MTKYLLLQNYEGGVCDRPMGTWDPADIRAHIDFHRALDDALTASGELIEACHVTGPEQARCVTSDGVATSTDSGPFDRPLLAGYRIVDVADEGRALDIAAGFSAAPGPAGVPLRQPIEVRRVMVPEPSRAS
jgi:hypothetical protein